MGPECGLESCLHAVRGVLGAEQVWACLQPAAQLIIVGEVHGPGNSTRGGTDWVMPALWALLASHEFLDHLRPAWGQPPMPTALGTEHGPGPQHRLDAVGSGQLAPQQPTRLDMLDKLIQRVVIGRQLGQSEPVGQSSVQIGDRGANLAE